MMKTYTESENKQNIENFFQPSLLNSKYAIVEKPTCPEKKKSFVTPYGTENA